VFNFFPGSVQLGGRRRRRGRGAVGLLLRLPLELRAPDARVLDVASAVTGAVTGGHGILAEARVGVVAAGTGATRRAGVAPHLARETRWCDSGDVDTV
jgi:hypothetical protein